MIIELVNNNVINKDTKRALRIIWSAFLVGCSTNPVGEKSLTGFFTCKKEKSRL